MLEEEYEAPKVWMSAELLCTKSRESICCSESKGDMCKNRRREGGGGTGSQLSAEDCGEDPEGTVPGGPLTFPCSVLSWCTSSTEWISGRAPEMQTLTSQLVRGSGETASMPSGAREVKEALRT